MTFCIMEARPEVAYMLAGAALEGLYLAYIKESVKAGPTMLKI